MTKEQFIAENTEYQTDEFMAVIEQIDAGEFDDVDALVGGLDNYSTLVIRHKTVEDFLRNCAERGKVERSMVCGRESVYIYDYQVSKGMQRVGLWVIPMADGRSIVAH